jgi:succinate-semialdehyde dehydrogenase/glutarate-semialdehyde dehydrogenase
MSNTDERPVFATRNPATLEAGKTYAGHSAADVAAQVRRAVDAQRQWRRVPIAERARPMHAAAAVLRARRAELAALMTDEMGKVVTDGLAEVDKCASACEHFADHAERYLAREKVEIESANAFVTYNPIGVVLAVMPWNFPFWQVIRFAAPALMAGNVALLKHAGNVPQCALTIEQIFRSAGFEEGVFQTLLIDAEQTGTVIDDSRVKAVTLTGSDRAGAEVASRAARQIKKSVLELGGSDPFIVMPSADLEAAAAVGVKSRTINAGQSCIAAKRFIVAEKIYGRYVEQFLARMRALRVGDPLDEATEIGPLATEQIRKGVHEQVQKTIDAGAKLLLGGRMIEGPGFYYAPTVLVDVPPDSPAAREEIFGPVAAFFRVRNEREAVAVGNDSPFGLGATAWTKDAREQEFFARELEAGMVFINGMVASDPRLPFGGVKRSGYGRELSVEGIREFVNMKTVVVA